MINDIRPFLLNNDIREIKHPYIANALEVKYKKAPVMAHKLFRRCDDFFKWCCSKGYMEINPMQNIYKKSIVPPTTTIHHKTVTESKELKRLIGGIYSLGSSLYKG